MTNYNTEDLSLNDFLYCTELIGERPSKAVLAFNFNTKEFTEFFTDVKYINTLTEISPDIEGSIVNEKNLIKLKNNIYMSYTHMDKSMGGFITNVVFYYKTDLLQEIETYISSIEKFILIQEVEDFKITCASMTPSGLIIEPMDVMIADYENIDHYFNDDTFKSASKLIKKINKSDKGLSVLYGKRGCGKTTMLNWIATNSTKKVIFISLLNIDATINSPSFKTHLMENDGVLLIIDDCELFNSDMYAKSSITFANILQMVDGFNSDDLMVNVLLSFNLEEEHEIDEDLLNCNNLIDIIKFSELKKSKANKLLKLLSVNYKVDNSILLNDLIKGKYDDKEINIGYV